VIAKIPGIQAKYISIEYRYFHGDKWDSPFPNTDARNAVKGKHRKYKIMSEGFCAHESRNSCRVI